MELTILMPCLNEEETLEACIRKAMSSIENHKLHAEILISDNGSTDGSLTIAESLGVRITHVKEAGYGSALRSGIENARGKYVIMADSDDSYDFGDIFSILSKLREGYDLVVGNRFQGGIEKNAMPFLHRYLGNPVLTFIGKLFFKIPIGDFHCGMRGVNRQAMLDISLSTTGMEFASEMIVKSSIYRQKISEVSVKLYADGRSRPPHLRTWHDGWRHLRFLLLYSPKWLFLYPGIMLMILGVLITSVIARKPLEIRSVTFDVHTMLYTAIMIIIGAQMVIFYFCSKIFAIKTGLDNNEKWIQNFNKYFSLEKGLSFGGGALLLGIILTIYSIGIWTNKSFGNLNPTETLRITIPAITLLTLGTQMILNSFFASILNLKFK